MAAHPQMQTTTKLYSNGFCKKSSNMNTWKSVTERLFQTPHKGQYWLFIDFPPFDFFSDANSFLFHLNFERNRNILTQFIPNHVPNHVQ